MRPLSLITAAVAAACFVAPITLNAQATATPTTVTCKDGSTSKAGKGACSHHGGVNKSAGNIVGDNHSIAGRGFGESLTRTSSRRDDLTQDIGVDGNRRQEHVREQRSHRRHREVQGRTLFAQQASLGDVLEARRRRAVAAAEVTTL